MHQFYRKNSDIFMQKNGQHLPFSCNQNRYFFDAMCAVILSNIQHYFALMVYWISRVFILYRRPDSTSDSRHFH